ncbi:hypothetical protein DFP73DRAFT_592857 [Morchella snyderi]|nr:hypothetical protein DFP73DRAFT_592857 [Morchella snyderi]
MFFSKPPLLNTSSILQETQNGGTSKADLFSVIGTWIGVILALLTILIHIYKYFTQNAEAPNSNTTNNNTYHLTQINNFNNSGNDSSDAGGDAYTIEEVA